MESDPDLHMAMLLQRQFDLEVNVENPPDNISYHRDKKQRTKDSTKSLTDPSWELVDPTPNIHILFVQFSEKFFWNKLGAVSVSWSKRMTTCAGVCRYQSRAGMCSITLSEPLLKLRPRKDLIETMLHEMIHAYLFVTRNNRDRDGHGPEFHKHMYRINGEAGTNITVYHNFHDEVKLYKQHWWRCSGPCQTRPPFFGMVRRATNRAPGPYDRWFAQHQQTCGGNFTKVKEPEKQIKPASRNKVIKSPIKNVPDIRTFFPTSPSKENKTTALNTNKKIKDNNIHLFDPNKKIKHLNDDTNKTLAKIEIFSGAGRVLNASSTSEIKNNDLSLVRNHWANKFSDSHTKITPNLKRKSLNFDTNVNKKIQTTTETFSKIHCPNCDRTVSETEIHTHLDNCLSTDDSIKSEFSNDSNNFIECPVCKVLIDEESINDHLDQCLHSTPKQENIVEPKSGSSKNAASSSKNCDICNSIILVSDYAQHVQDCLNKFYDDIEKKFDLPKTETEVETVKCLVCNKNIVKTDLNNHLDDCMASVFKNDDKFDDNDVIENETSDDNQIKKYNCPICMSAFDEIEMNSHIDQCIITADIEIL